eukprot:39458-Prymnesium_polylepis.2
MGSAVPLKCTMHAWIFSKIRRVYGRSASMKAAGVACRANFKLSGWAGLSKPYPTTFSILSSSAATAGYAA